MAVCRPEACSKLRPGNYLQVLASIWPRIRLRSSEARLIEPWCAAFFLLRKGASSGTGNRIRRECSGDFPGESAFENRCLSQCAQATRRRSANRALGESYTCLPECPPQWPKCCCEPCESYRLVPCRHNNSSNSPLL